MMLVLSDILQQTKKVKHLQIFRCHNDIISNHSLSSGCCAINGRANGFLTAVGCSSHTRKIKILDREKTFNVVNVQ